MAFWYCRISGWLGRNAAQLTRMATGLFLYWLYNFAYDYFFYPFALLYWGLLWGGVIAVLGSLVQNGIMFWWYDRMKVDWLGAQALRELEEKENRSRIERLATWLGKADKTWWEHILTATAFVALLMRIDPLVVAVHFQRRHFQGLSWRDWQLLLLAVAVGNFWWLLQAGIVVTGGHYAWDYLWAHL